MRLDISMELNRTFNCWQNIIHAISKYMKTESELLYLHSWNFDFIQEYVHGNNNSTNRYHYIDDYKLLEKVHGLKITFHDYDNEFPIVELIKKELLESRPVMVAIDTYDCHWVPDYYHKIHRSHFCLVIGMDESEKVLNILDSQYAIKGNTLEVDELMKGITQYVTVKRTEPDDSSIDWISLINESLNSISEEYESPFSDMRCFGEMMKSCDLNEETRGYENDISNAPLFKGINQIMKQRKQYTLVLLYIAKHGGYETINMLAEKFRMIGIQWSSVLGILVKVFYLHGDERLMKRAGEIIESLAEQEELLYDSLSQFVNGKSLCIESKMEESESFSITKYTMIDLTKYMNNKAIGRLVDYNCNASFTHDGKYMLYDESNIIENIIYNHIPFKSIKLTDTYDNISCENQVIELDSKNYEYLAILGCSEYSDHMGEFRIEYESGMSQNIMMNLSNWVNTIPSFSDKALLNFGVVQRVDSKYAEKLQMTAHLFASHYKLNSKEKVKKIVFPYYPNIHIFDITLFH